MNWVVNNLRGAKSQAHTDGCKYDFLMDGKQQGKNAKRNRKRRKRRLQKELQQQKQLRRQKAELPCPKDQMQLQPAQPLPRENSSRCKNPPVVSNVGLLTPQASCLKPLPYRRSQDLYV